MLKTINRKKCKTAAASGFWPKFYFLSLVHSNQVCLSSDLGMFDDRMNEGRGWMPHQWVTASLPGNGLSPCSAFCPVGKSTSISVLYSPLPPLSYCPTLSWYLYMWGKMKGVISPARGKGLFAYDFTHGMGLCLTPVQLSNQKLGA